MKPKLICQQRKGELSHQLARALALGVLVYGFQLIYLALFAFGSSSIDLVRHDGALQSGNKLHI